jgi:hypothetical protein
LPSMLHASLCFTPPSSASSHSHPSPTRSRRYVSSYALSILFDYPHLLLCCAGEEQWTLLFSSNACPRRSGTSIPPSPVSSRCSVLQYSSSTYTNHLDASSTQPDAIKPLQLISRFNGSDLEIELGDVRDHRCLTTAGGELGVAAGPLKASESYFEDGVIQCIRCCDRAS